MDKESMGRYLEECLDGYLYHKALPNEIMNILNKSGCEADFIKSLLRNLKMLQATGYNAVKNKNFKKLKKHNDLWRMDLGIKKMNIRIIYTYTTYGEAILLHAFFEKSGKNVSDYSLHALVAESRMEDIKNGCKGWIR